MWRSKVPSRVFFFAWEACHDAILTGDNLRRRRKIYVSWCFMCKGSGESTNHLLLHCPVARSLWNMVFSLFGFSWVMSRIVKELFLCWPLYKRRRRIHIWESAPLGVCWMWKERNRRAFESIEGTLEQLKSSLLRTLFFWCDGSMETPGLPNLSFVDFVKSFNFS